MAPRARRRLRICRFGLALGALILAAADHGWAQNPSGQAPASAEQLIERLRQIQGESSGTGASEQELLDRLRQLQDEAGAARTTGAPQAEARLSADQVRQQISQALGVQVLHVERVAALEHPTYALKVMNPPGNYNAAFRVVTLLVDGDTGAVLGELQATADAENPDAFPALREPGEQSSGLELRRRTWR